ncbi:helix-turn-helix domain-containing protein [Kitasatospora sp. NPDC093679]|uniref:helix-turn-helix domain-containing protein n=1 Tax=Kitasatospora sp. NPDC093679 TaxID=3154983 RepID=UPI00341A84EB
MPARTRGRRRRRCSGTAPCRGRSGWRGSGRSARCCSSSRVRTVRPHRPNCCAPHWRNAAAVVADRGRTRVHRRTGAAPGSASAARWTRWRPANRGTRPEPPCGSPSRAVRPRRSPTTRRSAPSPCSPTSRPDRSSRARTSGRLRSRPHVRALEDLSGREEGAPAVAALAAFCRTGSLRQAAAELHLHHSSVAARLARVEEETGWRLRDPQDRFRAQLAWYAWRLTRSAAD